MNTKDRQVIEMLANMDRRHKDMEFRRFQDECHRLAKLNAQLGGQK